MKKAVVTLVVGEKYQGIYSHVAPLNRKWMDRWGRESIIIESIPDDFKARYSKKDQPCGRVRVRLYVKRGINYLKQTSVNPRFERPSS